MLTRRNAISVPTRSSSVRPSAGATVAAPDLRDCQPPNTNSFVGELYEELYRSLIPNGIPLYPPSPSHSYYEWLENWPDMAVPVHSSSSSISSVSFSSNDSDAFSASLPRRSNTRHNDERRHGVIINTSNSTIDLSPSNTNDVPCPSYDDLVACRGPPPPYEEEQVLVHDLSHLSPGPRDVHERKRSRCSSIGTQMVNMVRVDSVLNATETMVKTALKALEARRARRKLAWLGKRKYI